MELKIEFTDKEITSWAGMALMKNLLDRTKIVDQIQKLNLPQPGSNCGYLPEDILKSFWMSVWCGANKFSHTEVTRQDDVLRKIFELKRMPSDTTIKRFFEKFSLQQNNEIFTELYQWFFEQLQFDNYTLDVDSSVLIRYGEQEGAETGYNSIKPGRKTNHPLLAFISECRMVCNYWHRSGKAYTSNNFEAFLEDTLNKLRNKKIGLFRADSGFCGDKIFKCLENEIRRINYIIAARLYVPVKRKLIAQTQWFNVAKGICVAETMYQAQDWDIPRRMIMVRQEIESRPKATGKQINLFGYEDIFQGYRYSCYITNMDLPAYQIWNLYKQRGDAENRIKELKYDFGFDSFNLKDFWATEAALNFVMIAYNLISLFKQVVYQTKEKPQMKTLRYRCFAVGAYFVKNGSQNILKLSLAMKRREWFTGLWENSKIFSPPVIYQN
jgi:hypothetical protein